MQREQEIDLLRKEKCGKAAESEPKVEGIVARIWQTKLVPTQLWSETKASCA